MNRTEDWRQHGPAAGPGPESDPAASSEDARVVRALQEYRDALQAGQKPDRQLFLARHAEIPPSLAECLDGLEFIQGAAPQLQADVGPPNTSTVLPAEMGAGAVLGNYEVMHEIGRGRM